MTFNDVNTLEIDNITKEYFTGSFFDKKKKKTQALRGVSLVFTPGLYGLIGANGAGKSTLINIITGGVNQTSGRVLYNNITTRKMDAAFRRILGYVPQQQTLYDSFTGRQFLLYMCSLKEIPQKQMDSEVIQVASATNIINELDKKLSAYSGGMKQRLLTANALIGSPEILVMDEPSAGLDPKERVRLRNLIKEIAKTTIVIVATHVVSDIENVADEIILLKDGLVVDKGEPSYLIEKYAEGKTLEDVYIEIFGDD